jgi:hypothetical protein
VATGRAGPAFGDREEEIQPRKQVEYQRGVELDLGPAVVLRHPVRVRIHNLPFLPASPMPSSLPHAREPGGHHQREEEALQHDWHLLQIVPIDVHAGE